MLSPFPVHEQPYRADARCPSRSPVGQGYREPLFSECGSDPYPVRLVPTHDDPMTFPTRRKPQHLEGVEQRLFVQRFRLDPRTRDLPACAIPNGGRRGPREAALLKAEGVSAGAPDWVLFVPSADKQCNGIALEFKNPNGKGRVSPEQKAWHERLTLHHWSVHIVNSAQGAWTAVCTHLGIEP